ncbi:MAG: MmcQ/YjbR family DNA-binding protein [Candidatus Binatia bacterium]|nr:MmcQ/YjbR family DNA-binding protein [Candidatus Binatia bacterium]
MPKKEPVPIKFPPSKDLARRFARVVRLAKKLPGVEESRSYGTPSLKVKTKVLARLRSEAEGGLALLCDFEERQILTEAEPETFYITDHYAEWPMVLINLTKVS